MLGQGSGDLQQCKGPGGASRGAIDVGAGERVGEIEDLPAQPLGLVMQVMLDEDVDKASPGVPMMIEDRFDGVEGVAIDPVIDVVAVDVDDARRHARRPPAALGAHLVLEGMLAAEYHEG